MSEKKNDRNEPPNLRDAETCEDCTHVKYTRNEYGESACWCKKYNIWVSDLTICDDWLLYRLTWDAVVVAFHRVGELVEKMSGFAKIIANFNPFTSI